MTRLLWCAVGMVCLLAGSSGALGEGLAAESRVEAVTVYRGQALVTRAVTVPAKTGDLELVVGDLPARILGSSLSASGADGVRIRSVRYRVEVTAVAPKKEVADLDKKIKDLAAQEYDQRQMMELLKAKGKHLDKLEGFAAPTASVEMSKGVLNTKTLAEVSGYILKAREALTAERIKLNRQVRDRAEQLALLQRKRAELTRGGGRAKREALIFVSKAAKGPGKIRLMYLVSSASWTPAYNIRLGDDGKAVTVEYLAGVSQMSGEDWSGVKLTLSTATPGTNAMTPILAPMWVNLQQVSGKRKGPSVRGWSYSKYTQSVSDNTYKQLTALDAWQAYKGNVDDANWGLNSLAAEQQRVELNVKEAFVRGRRPGAAMAEVLAVSYSLPGAMSLPSRSDRQLVQIEAIKLVGRSYYEAIPLLSGYVYRNIRVKNTSALPLLAGRYSAYIGADFVGKGTLPLVARGQEIAIGVGADTQLRCRRELVDKSDRISWGSQVQNFHYRLTLENFKDAPVDVRLIDRIPASRSDDLKVSLGKLKDKLSEDPLYVRDERDRGVLRWDITLPANAAGAKARQVDYTFQLKYAKDAHIGREAAAVMPQMEMEFRRAAAKAH